MAVQFIIGDGSATVTFLLDSTLVQRNDGQWVRVDALQDGDVFMSDGGWTTVASAPVVT